MAEIRHGVLVAAGLLGIVRERGWVEGPYKVDLPRVIAEVKAHGGVTMERAPAVEHAIGLMRQVAEMDPDQPTEWFANVLALAYDELVERVTNECAEERS